MNDVTETTDPNPSTDSALRGGVVETNLSPNYRPWLGIWEGVRERVQNGLDGHVDGHELSIVRGSGKSKTVVVRNAGVVLDRHTLVMGETTKAADASAPVRRYIGYIGEGSQLSDIALLRAGLAVKIRTGWETWIPFFEESKAYGRAVLKYEIRRQEKYLDAVEVQISGLSDEDWTACVAKLLCIPGLQKTWPKAKDMIVVGGSRILTSEKHRGQLYCRGLYVCALPDHGYQWGYDLSEIKLDLDRKMADPWSLRFAIRDLLGEAVAAGKLEAAEVYNMLATDTAESRSLAAIFEYGSAPQLAKSVSEEFTKRHGVDAVVAASVGDAQRAEHVGLKAAIVAPAIRHAVESHVGKLEERITAKGTDVTTYHSLSDFAPDERTTLDWSLRVISAGVPGFDGSNLAVVTFVSDLVCGTFTEGQLRIARRLLKDRVELIATIVHEYAHAKGGDGSVQHEREIERLMAQIVVALSEGL